MRAKQILKQNSKQVSWITGLVVVLLDIIVWGNYINWNFSGLTGFDYFPLFGLIAFTLMWTHYALDALFLWADTKTDQLYRRLSGFAILVSLLLHPLLFYRELYGLGYGLPPQSYIDFLGEDLARYVFIGFVAWIGFLLYEFKKLLIKKPSVWRVVLAINAIGMIVIYFHGLKLGRHLQTGWFMWFWHFLGLTLFIALIYQYKKGYLLKVKAED